MSKIVLVTGASRGIGRATALAFAQAGYNVAITARHLGQAKHGKDLVTEKEVTGLAKTAALIEAIGVEVLAVEMDLLHNESIAHAMNTIIQYFGSVDVLINNAIYQGPDLNNSFADLTSDTLQKVAQAYIIAPVHIIQTLLPAMLTRPAPCIINITSGAGAVDPPIAAKDGGWGYAYGAGKAAVSRLAGILCREYDTTDLRAFTVNPGVVDTETLRNTIGDQGVQGLGQAVAQPEEIASALLWVAESSTANKLRYKTIDAQKILKEYLPPLSLRE